MTTTVVGASAAPLVRRVELDVSGMTCAACANRVQTRLNKLDGVRASVNYATRVATVDAPEGMSSGDLCDVVERAGYQAQLRVPGGEELPDPDDAVARSLLRRLAVAAVLFVPLSHLSVMFAVLPETRFAGGQWLLTVLALPIVTWAAWPFHRVAWRNARHRTASMETLISVGVTAATLWSLYTIFAAHPERRTTGLWQALMSSDAIYLEVAAGVTVFILAGRYFEARAKSKAGSALRALAALSAKNVAVVLPDGGRGYMSKIFNDAWMSSYGFLRTPLDGSRPEPTVGDVLRGKSGALPDLVHTHPSETVRDAIGILREYGVSQMPVVGAEPPVMAGEVAGSVSERELLSAVFEGRAHLADAVAEHMSPPLPLIGAGEQLSAAEKVLRDADAVMVVEGGKPVGVITRHDLLGYLSEGPRRR
jgi:CBS domain-containing protein/copper chaperone CopZ